MWLLGGGTECTDAPWGLVLHPVREATSVASQTHSVPSWVQAMASLGLGLLQAAIAMGGDDRHTSPAVARYVELELNNGGCVLHERKPPLECTVAGKFGGCSKNHILGSSKAIGEQSLFSMN